MHNKCVSHLYQIAVVWERLRRGGCRLRAHKLLIPVLIRQYDQIVGDARRNLFASSLQWTVKVKALLYFAMCTMTILKWLRIPEAAQLPAYILLLDYYVYYVFYHTMRMAKSFVSFMLLYRASIVRGCRLVVGQRHGCRAVG